MGEPPGRVGPASNRDTSLFALVRGEAGIGKSRLAEELFALCERRGHRGPDSLLLGTWQPVLCSRYRPPADTARLRSGIEHLQNPQLSELARILPELLLEEREIAAPQPLAESWQRQHFFEALMAAFRLAPGPCCCPSTISSGAITRRWSGFTCYCGPSRRAV